MDIRPFSEDDAVEASELIGRCLSEVTSKHYDARAIEQIREEYTPERLVEKARKSTMLIAELDGQVVGTVRLEGDTIFTLYVDPSKHRSRIGSKLMTQVESLARERGYARVRVEALVSSTGFYARRGYHKVRVISQVGFGDVVEMEHVF
ncbi:MAG: GNAT family N-acetyltransferase [Candidatus Woesearchaeota archaeon]